ncbi:MAG TPA: energy-coupling factor ABC transporter permease, partial [Bryobacteraceae bacterium]
MHIPDGFLATPVWVSLDAAAVPAAGFIVRRAQRGFDEARVPLLGVMGAFVFAAQMINFPVGIGTTGHLVGGALLAFTLGPAAASVVMMAIITIQALIFQDGGILALGPNIINMAIAGVLAGYLPFYLSGGGKWRKLSIFAGGALSVLISAVLALIELLVSGVRMPTPVLAVSLGLFVVSALLEGAITLAVIQALESIQPDFVRTPVARRSYALGAVSLCAVFLAA